MNNKTSVLPQINFISMHRMPQVNKLLQNELAQLISQRLEMPNVLVTVSFVKCSPNLRDVSIGLSILPEKQSGSVLKKIRKLNSPFATILKKKLAIKKIPHFNWLIDVQEREAAEIDNILNKLKQQRK